MNPGTILYRQAHPSFVHEGLPSSEVFFPFPKDQGLLSAYDGDMVSASQSHIHFTETLLLKSDSVWAVSKSESDSEDVPARPDPEPFPAHVVLDFTGKDKKECRKIAKRLKSLALARGCQFR